MDQKRGLIINDFDDVIANSEVLESQRRPDFALKAPVSICHCSGCRLGASEHSRWPVQPPGW
jgi:hypothetical protein